MLYIVVNNTFVEGGDYWYQPEGEGGTPILAYPTEKQAKEACDRMNLQAKCEEHLHSFCYDINDLIASDSQRAFELFLQTRGLTHPSNGEWYAINDLEISDADKRELASYIRLEFFSWYEVPLEQSNPKEKEEDPWTQEERFKNLDI